MKTTLVNVRTYRGSMDGVVLIDRRTPYGNPFRIGDWNVGLARKLTREDCVELFKVHFWCRMNEDASFRSAVERLRGKKLACWCTPLACHGDVYVEYFENDNC